MENMFSNICHLSHQLGIHKHIERINIEEFQNGGDSCLGFDQANMKRVGNPVATNKFGLPNWNSSQNGQTITGLEKGKIKLS